MRKFIALPAVALLCLLLVGCKDPYGNAAKLAQDVAVSVNQATITVDSFRASGAISAAEEKDILGYLNSLNALDGVYIGCVQGVHGGTSKVTSFTGCAQSFATSMGDPTTLAALHVSNPKSQAEVTGVVRGIVTLVETTITALGGK